MTKKVENTNIVWMDLEMTGLNPEVDRIIEIATIITDYNLEIIATGPNIIIKQDAKMFDNMDDWNKNQHTKSGLWEKVLDSEISETQAQQQTLEFITKYTTKNCACLAGNSIWQDRRFINKYMQDIDTYLHYRMIDVSTIKELVSKWYPNLETFIKKESHRALGDIEESIDELKYFRSKAFVELN